MVPVQACLLSISSIIRLFIRKTELSRVACSGRWIKDGSSCCKSEWSAMSIANNIATRHSLRASLTNGL
jgi:hypothetical protein